MIADRASTDRRAAAAFPGEGQRAPAAMEQREITNNGVRFGRRWMFSDPLLVAGAGLEPATPAL